LCTACIVFFSNHEQRELSPTRKRGLAAGGAGRGAAEGLVELGLRAGPPAPAREGEQQAVQDVKAERAVEAVDRAKRCDICFLTAVYPLRASAPTSSVHTCVM
ncbi:unnamed protein product, partial [Ectocarpus fasciculatus]